MTAVDVAKCGTCGLWGHDSAECVAFEKRRKADAEARADLIRRGFMPEPRPSKNSPFARVEFSWNEDVGEMTADVQFALNTPAICLTEENCAEYADALLELQSMLIHERQLTEAGDVA